MQIPSNMRKMFETGGNQLRKVFYFFSVSLYTKVACDLWEEHVGSKFTTFCALSVFFPVMIFFTKFTSIVGCLSDMATCMGVCG